MAKMEGLAHVGLFVTDIEKTKAFYGDVLDFEVVYECGVEEADGTTTKVAFIRNGNLTIEVIQTAAPQKRADGWFDHIAIAVEDIDAIRDMLAQRGVVFESEEVVFNRAVFPNGSKWILFRGPDNEHLEITEVVKY